MYNQFNPGTILPEQPNKTSGTNRWGWGMCQIDRGRTGLVTRTVYDWKTNVDQMNATLTEKASVHERFMGYYRSSPRNNVWLTVAAIGVAAISFAEGASTQARPSNRRDIMKGYTERFSPYQWFKAEEWNLLAVFSDYDGDGMEEALVSDPDGRTDRLYVWNYAWKEPGQSVAYDTGLAERSVLLCGPESFYKVTMSDSDPFVIASPANCEKYVKEERVSAKEGTFRVTAKNRGECCFCPIPRGVGAILQHMSFKRLDHMVPAVYGGFDVRLTRSQSPDADSVERSPEPEPPADVGRVLFELGWSKGLVVCFDADNDGDIDCYLAKGEVRAREEEDWTLYLNKDGRLNQATTPVVLNRKRGYAVTALAPKVRARANGFHRVAFNYKTTEDAVVVLAKENGKLVLRGCEACLREFPPESVLSAESLVSDFGFASLERLPCQTCSASGADAKHSDIDPRGAK